MQKDNLVADKVKENFIPKLTTVFATNHTWKAFYEVTAFIILGPNVQLEYTENVSVFRLLILHINYILVWSS